MTLLLLGLVIFIGTHLSTAARGNRKALIARFGEGGYKGLYSLLSLIGIVLIGSVLLNRLLSGRRQK